MRQLVQLQNSYQQFRKLDTEVIGVLREDKLTVEGLRRAKDKTKAEFPLLDDLGTKTTQRYSQTGFSTYVIDKQGVIRAVLEGTKAKRPTAAAILAQVKAVAQAE